MKPTLRGRPTEVTEPQEWLLEQQLKGLMHILKGMKQRSHRVESPETIPHISPFGGNFAILVITTKSGKFVQC